MRKRAWACEGGPADDVDGGRGVQWRPGWPPRDVVKFAGLCRDHVAVYVYDRTQPCGENYSYDGKVYRWSHWEPLP